MLEHTTLARHFGGENLPPSTSKPIVATLRMLSVGVGRDLRLTQKTVGLEPVQRLVKRRRSKSEIAVGQARGLLLDRVTVPVAIGEGNEDVERASGERTFHERDRKSERNGRARVGQRPGCNRD